METPKLCGASRYRTALVNGILTCTLVGMFVLSGCATSGHLPPLVANPKSATDYYKRGRYYQAKNQCLQAIPEYAKAVALDPSYEDAYYAKGMCSLGVNDYQTAESDFTHLINLRPKQIEYYRFRANARAYLENIDKALDDCDTALALSPKNTALRSAKAVLLFEQGRFAQSLTEYRAVHEGIPNAEVASAVAVKGITGGVLGVLLDPLGDIKSARSSAKMHSRMRETVEAYIDACEFLLRPGGQVAAASLISPGMSQKEVLRNVLVTDRIILEFLGNIDRMGSSDRILFVSVSRAGSVEDRELRILVFDKGNLTLEKRLKLKEVMETPGISEVTDILPGAAPHRSVLTEYLRKKDLIIYEDNLQIVTVTEWQIQRGKRVRAFNFDGEKLTSYTLGSRRLW